MLPTCQYALQLGGLLLLVTALLVPGVAAQPQQLQQNSSSALRELPELGAGRLPLHVCTASWSPMVNCSAAQPPAQYSGHDMDVFRQAAALLGLQEGADYQYSCMPFSAMIADLTAENGTCAMAIAGITVTTKRQGLGIAFSYPYFHSGLGMLVKTVTAAPDGWAFTKPFSWDLWLALGVTLLVLPTLLFIIEFLSLKKRIRRQDVWPGTWESTVRSMWQVMLFDNVHVSSSGARVAVLCFGFVSLLLANTYTASLASFLTVTSLKSQITGVTDLRGRAVASHGIYVQELHDSFGLAVINQSFNSGADQLKLGQEVSSGALASAIDDLPAMEYVANTAVPLCDLRVLEAVLLPFDYAIAFKKGTSDGLVEAFSGAILRLQEKQVLEELRQLYIVGSTAYGGCSTHSQATTVRDEAAAVGFANVWGLWVILGAGVVAGGAIMLGQRSYRRWRKQGPWRKQAPGPGGMERLDSTTSGDSLGIPFPQRGNSRRFLAVVASKVRRGQKLRSQGDARRGGGVPRQDSGGGGSANGQADLKASPKAEALDDPASPPAGTAPARRQSLSALQQSHSIFKGASVTWGGEDV